VNVAIVTGGSTGIGAEICRQMLTAGYEVVSLSLGKPKQTHPRLHSNGDDFT
jgi:NAD(P)-dependent dehydrogenase (short-subunit alcohol dehydrogenase family)